MAEILDFVTVSLLLLKLIYCVTEKRKVKKEYTNNSSKISKKEDDEDITLNKYLFQKKNEYKK